MSEATFESVRLGSVAIMVLLRIILMPFFLQSFLNIAQDKVTELQKEAGRILNTDLQKKVHCGLSICAYDIIYAFEYIFAFFLP